MESGQQEGLMKKCVLYARSAVACRASVGAQLTALRDWAAEKGLEIVGEYQDNGISGITLDRPGLQKLLEDGAKGGIGVLLCYDIAHLSRDLEQFHELCGRLKSLGIEIVFVKG